MDEEAGEHGYRWDSFTIVWRDLSASDESHRQASHGKYGLVFQGEVVKEKSSWLLHREAVVAYHI